jgi:hypothetical protein
LARRKLATGYQILRASFGHSTDFQNRCFNPYHPAVRNATQKSGQNIAVLPGWEEKYFDDYSYETD